MDKIRSIKIADASVSDIAFSVLIGHLVAKETVIEDDKMNMIMISSAVVGFFISRAINQ